MALDGGQGRQASLIDQVKEIHAGKTWEKRYGQELGRGPDVHETSTSLDYFLYAHMKLYVKADKPSFVILGHKWFDLRWWGCVFMFSSCISLSPLHFISDILFYSPMGHSTTWNFSSALFCGMLFLRYLLCTTAHCGIHGYALSWYTFDMEFTNRVRGDKLPQMVHKYGTVPCGIQPIFWAVHYRNQGAYADIRRQVSWLRL